MPRSCRARRSTGRARTSPRTALCRADVAPDGTAAVAYLKGAPTPHVWVSRLVGGAWGAPEQVESLPGAASNPRIAVANGGKVVVTFANGGNLQAVIKPTAGAAFGTPANIGTGGSYGEIDLAPNGNGYVAIKAGNVLTAVAPGRHDVHAGRRSPEQQPPPGGRWQRPGGEGRHAQRRHGCGDRLGREPGRSGKRVRAPHHRNHTWRHRGCESRFAGRRAGAGRHGCLHARRGHRRARYRLGRLPAGLHLRRPELLACGRPPPAAGRQPRNGRGR